MIQRSLYEIAFEKKWGRQMRFVTGPRQCGKTTLAKTKLKEASSEELYFLWELRAVRNQYKNNELFFTDKSSPSKIKKWVCFDEIHKMPKWKNILKGIFDSTEEYYYFVVTGSAKLNIFRKAGDSLAGRYFTFNLFPLSLSEVIGHKRSFQLPSSAKKWLLEKMDTPKKAAGALTHLLEYSGFPQPFLHQSKSFYRKWSDDYSDTVIKEDIGSLTRIIEWENLFDLYQLLPEMVANPLSVSSLASHLELSHPTVKNYLNKTVDFFLTFKIHPYSKNIKRSLLQIPKYYLFDWAKVKDESKRFENYVAVELMSTLQLWMDATGENFSLFYIRNKQKNETDFLIVKNQEPWLLIEAKQSDTHIESHHLEHKDSLGQIPLVQICRKEGVCKMSGQDVFVLSASQFFSS